MLFSFDRNDEAMRGSSVAPPTMMAHDVGKRLTWVDVPRMWRS